jgi:hypothetical protein
MVTVAPVTHTAPVLREAAVEIPTVTKQRLGLDEARSWIVVTEGNRFAWPGPDIRPVAAGRFDYGFLPPALFHQVQKRFAAWFAAKRVAVVKRTE